MSPIRLHRWVFDALSRLYPGRYFSCRQPVIRPKRRSVRCELEQYERHEAPTAIMAVDPVTADLLNFAALHEPFPPDATASIAVGQAASLSADRIGDLPAEQAYFSAKATSSPLSPGGRGAGGEGAQSFSASASLLATITAANSSPNLEAIQNPQAPFLDPLGLDIIAPPHPT